MSNGEGGELSEEKLRSRLALLKREGAARGSDGFSFCKFSQKQRLALGWWRSQRYAGCEGIIADGAVRSGKTLALSLGFVLWAMSEYSSQSFAICGRTQGAVRRNVLSSLKQMLPACGLSFSEKRAEGLIEIACGGASNRFYIFGAKDERAQDLIQGMTLAGVLFDEAALMPESFINQATARCSVRGSKFWFSCNPQGPRHFFKLRFIDRARERRLLYLHFTMSDNLSLDSAVKKRYASLYQGVFYRRYVLGQWCMAEGLVYPMFSETENVRVSSEPAQRRFLSCDYGTHNPFAVGLFAVRDGCYHLERELYHDSQRSRQLTDSEYADLLEQRFKQYEVQYIIVDPSAASFIAELRRRGYRVIRARNNVSEGIRRVSEELAARRLTIDPSCVCTLAEFGEYCWDAGACEHGEDKPLKTNDHAMDMIRYALMTDRRAGAVHRSRTSGKGAIG